MNSKFRDMFGYDLSDIPDGRSWFKRVYPDDRLRQEAITTWQDEISGLPRGERKLKVFAVTCADGSQKMVNFIPLKLASGDYLVTCEDITELKKLERQLRQSQKMEAIGSLAGGIAHDFNNILTTLMGYAGLLQMEMDKHDPLGLHVEQIISASQKAANLTRSLLAFSRQQPIVLNPVSINDTIRSTEKLLKRLLTEDVDFRVSLQPEEWSSWPMPPRSIRYFSILSPTRVTPCRGEEGSLSLHPRPTWTKGSSILTVTVSPVHTRW
jgi:signal transduction histidine kinase